jgi:hypothetical protein
MSKSQGSNNKFGAIVTVLKRSPSGADNKYKIACHTPKTGIASLEIAMSHCYFQVLPIGEGVTKQLDGF